MSYLIMDLMGFMLIGIGTVGYFQSTVIKETSMSHTYQIKDGKTGQILQASFQYDVSKEWEFIKREATSGKE